MEPEDLDVLYRIENDSELWNVGVTNVPYSRFMLHDYIAHATGDIYADKQVRLMIEAGCGDVVGLVDLINFDPRHLRAEIGIVVEKRQRRLGYAIEALRLLLNYARRTLHLHQLYVVIAADNQASLALFGKLGFKQSATLSQWLFDGTAFHDAVLLQYVFA